MSSESNRDCTKVKKIKTRRFWGLWLLLFSVFILFIPFIHTTTSTCVLCRLDLRVNSFCGMRFERELPSPLTRKYLALRPDHRIHLMVQAPDSIVRPIVPNYVFPATYISSVRDRGSIWRISKSTQLKAYSDGEILAEVEEELFQILITESIGDYSRARQLALEFSDRHSE